MFHRLKAHPPDVNLMPVSPKQWSTSSTQCPVMFNE